MVRKSTGFLLLVVALACASPRGDVGVSRPDVVITKAQPDRVYQIEVPGEVNEFDRRIQPAVREAIATYPSARTRFLAGLPEGYHLFVTVRVLDSVGGFEQLFVLVDSIRKGVIDGRVWSEVQGQSGLVQGQTLQANESEILDWTILRPDGSEEGNFVGKLLDKLQGESQ